MSKLMNVNTTDLEDAISLGCRTMQRVFNADDNGVPFFGSSIVPHIRSPETRLSFSTWISEAHVPGRHLNALLNAEAVAGVRLDESAIEKHTRAAFLSFSGPLPLPLNRPEVGAEPVNFFPHNLREGLHALYPLVQYRYSHQARETAERMIATVLDYWDPERGWNTARLGERGLNVHPLERQTFITGEARMLGPLVKYYRATDSGLALELALLLKEKAINEFFREDGAYDGALFGYHTHSTTCTLSSLAQLADLTCDSKLMDRVRAFYANGLWEIRDDLGWEIEAAVKEHFSRLAKTRRAHPSLYLGSRRVLAASKDHYAYVRKHANDAALVVINRSSQAQRYIFDLAPELGDATLVDALSDASISIHKGRAVFEVAPMRSAVFVSSKGVHGH